MEAKNASLLELGSNSEPAIKWDWCNNNPSYLICCHNNHREQFKNPRLASNYSIKHRQLHFFLSKFFQILSNMNLSIATGISRNNCDHLLMVFIFETAMCGTVCNANSTYARRKQAQFFPELHTLKSLTMIRAHDVKLL